MAYLKTWSHFRCCMVFFQKLHGLLSKVAWSFSEVKCPPFRGCMVFFQKLYGLLSEVEWPPFRCAWPSFRSCMTYFQRLNGLLSDVEWPTFRSCMTYFQKLHALLLEVELLPFRGCMTSSMVSKLDNRTYVVKWNVETIHWQKCTYKKKCHVDWRFYRQNVLH